MNNRCYRLVFSKLRGMLVAVSETAIAQGKSSQGETAFATALQSITLFAMRHAAFAALALFGLAPVLAHAQIVPSGAHAPNVISTANGLPQVNVARPSGAGVSLNTYSQFDVSKSGAILNNSPTITNTQLAGQISGNPNFGPNDAAKIIVNQVNSNNPSQLRGYVEVAGQKTAAVVIANSSGLVVDGGGFLNTTRGILTTGNPLIDGNGNLTGFSVTGGTITVQGAGLNASNIDEVDLLARAVQANAAIYANTLNITTGSNNIDYASLTPTAIAGSGAAPVVAIDVSQLGGMYANRIMLVGTENGVGVANAGTIAAQAGDLTLTSSGQLVQSGQMSASGNVSANAASVANSGTIYAQQNTAIGAAGALTNSGAIAAQHNTRINAASLASTGTLGAGVANDGPVGNSGDLTVATTGQLSATGENVAGGNASFSGSGVNLAGSETAANGNLSLTANAGDLNLAGATTSAGGSVAANAAGTLDNDDGSLTGGAVTLNAGNLSNQGGEISAQGPLVARASRQIANQGGSMVSQGAMQVNGGAIANNQGTMQSAAGLSVSGATLDNTAGRITSLNGDGLSVTATGAITNAAGTSATGAQGGVIGGNGAVTLQGGRIANHGAVTAQTNLQVTGQSVDNSSGSLAASGNTTVNAGSHLVNSGGSITAGQTVTESATTLENSGGTTQGAQLSLNATNLVNHAGTITQSGTGPMNVAVSGTLDNSAGGTIQTNSTDLTLTSAAIDNDGGTITHAGTGKLTIDAGNGTGSASNAGGKIQGNGQVGIDAGAFNNAAGSVAGQTGLKATVGGALNNSNGKLLSNANLSLASGTLNDNGGQIGAGSNATLQSGSMTNRGGSIVAPNLALTIGGTLDNSGGDIEANQLALGATDLLNHAGTITQYGASSMGLNVGNTLDNSNGGTIQTNSTDLTLAPAALDNDGGRIIDAGTGTLTIRPGNGTGSFSNAGGQIITAGQIAAQAGSLNNAGGVLAAQRNIAANIAGDINNTQGAIRSLLSGSVTAGGSLTNTNGQIQSGTGAAGDASTLAIQAASLDNTGGLISNLGTGDETVQGGSQTINSGGVITGNGNVAVNTSVLLNTRGAQLSGGSVAVQAGAVDNSGGQIGTFAGSSGDVGITTRGAITNSNGQIGATRDLTINAATLTGGGAYSAANDVAVTIQGDFAPTPDVQFSAGHDLTFTLPGTFTSNAVLQAVDNLAINANDIANSGAMMAGGTLTTHSATLENTGAIVGASVSLNATQSIQNVGPAALIGATDSNGTLELLAPDIENRDDTTMTDTQATTAIYGLGKVVLAGGKNADGSYTNANLIRNQSALIQSAGDMALHASQVTNTRTTMTTTGLNQPVDPALLDQLGLSLLGCTAIYMAACGPGNPVVSGHDASGNNLVGDPGMIGGAFIDPPHGGSMNSTYQYTTYTGTALANLIASISPQAQIIAGGNLDASNVGTLQNYWSAVAAVGNVAMPVTLDQNSWQGQTAPDVQMTYSGLYHYLTYDGHYWTYSFCASGCNAPADVKAHKLPDYESTWTAGGTISGTGISINNTAGNAGIPSLGLAPGQALSGVTIGGISGSAGGTKSGAASVNGSGSMVNPVIASATAINVLSNLTIPQGGLFRPDTAPNAPYLIETNPAFTSQKSFISSDYYLNQLGLNPQNVEKRLGDGLYEQQLVQNQITSLTGKAVLGPYTDTQSLYEALLAAGASLAGSLNLPLGMALSADQVAALTSNVIIMQTEVVDGQSVLVPVVYLAKASQQDMNGPLIAATDIDLKNTQTFNNSGTVQASNTLSIQGQQINNAFGALNSGGLMSLTTTGNVELSSATVNAGSLALNAGGNLILNTAVNTVNQVSDTGATRTTTTLGPIANLNVKGDAAIVTGGNFEQNGANLNVGGNLGMSVGGNYDIGTVQTGEHKVVARANGISNTDINQTSGSSVTVGGVSAIGVGGNLTATGATISLGGGGAVVAKGDVTLQAAKATSTVDSNSATSDHNGSYTDSLHTSSDTLTATTLNSGNSLTVAAGHDIDITGSTLNLDQGTATLAAANNVNIGAATATYVDDSTQTGSHNHVVSSKAVAGTRDTTTTVSQGSLISADRVGISSGNDINVAGSTIVGTNDVSLSAAHDVNITTTQDTMQSSGTYQEKHTGLGTSGLSVTTGTSKLATSDQESGVTNNASTVGSINGNLSIQAGNTLHVTGSDLVAGGNVTGSAANVIIDAATDTTHQAQTQKTSSSGVTIGLSGSVGDAINGAYQQGQALASGNSNGRADALHAIAAGGDAGLAGYGAYQLAKHGVNNPAGASIGVQVSVGSSHSQSQSSEDQTIQRGSNVAAGGTAAFVATGNGTSGSGNLTIAGSNVSANDVLLAGANQVNIVNTTNTDVTQSSNSSSSASVGVSVGTNGVGISASMANAHGDGNSSAAIQNASHVNGANSVTVISGGDTNIIGSQVNGGQVSASVGGDLNIASVQDVTQSNAHQQSSGGSFTISQGGGGASFSTQHGDGQGRYANVSTQAGIYAADGGFSVNVNGNTDLKGGVIASTADAGKNSLTTGTLTYSDITNSSSYSASSSGFGAGGSIGNSGKAVGPASVSGSGGVTPMMSQHDNGNENGTTHSAVSAGTVTITDQANQVQDVANLSRDTTNTNGTVTKTPDVNDLLDRQSDMMGAASAAGQAVAQGIGQFADHERDTATDKATADAWAEGGSNRVGLHIAGGALIGGLGGGSAFSTIGGAAGAGVAAWAAGDLNRLANGTRDALGGGDAAQLAGNVATNILAGGMGALVGGGAGAFTASNADLYNRSTGNGDGQGSTTNSALDWIGDQLASAGRGAENLANQFAALVNANGPQGPYVSPDDLNGPGGNSKPPAAGGSAVPVAVCVPPVCTVVPATTPGTPGYAPGNATLNSGGGDAQISNSGDSDASLPMGSKSNQFNQPKNPSYQPTRNTPGAVDGTDYAGHAFDRMQDRGLTPSVIQNTIENGVPTPSRGGTTVFYDSINNVSVVTNSEGKVITVKYGK